MARLRAKQSETRLLTTIAALANGEAKRDETASEVKRGETASETKRDETASEAKRDETASKAKRGETARRDYEQNEARRDCEKERKDPMRGAPGEEGGAPDEGGESCQGSRARKHDSEQRMSERESVIANGE